MTLTIELAPMQGFTDRIFRNAYLKYFEGIDATYSPFILLNKRNLKTRDAKELDAGRGEPCFTPQIAVCSPDEAHQLARLISRKAQNRLNLNLGCPYPMLTKKGRGAGALPYPERIEAILETLFAGPFKEISIKTRLGMTHHQEFEALIPVFNRFDLHKVIIHPRLATQKYSGSPNWQAFGAYASEIRAPIVANGDIEIRQDADDLKERYPFIHGVMIGRGILMDPFLPQKIKGTSLPSDPSMILRGFHDHIFDAHRERLSPRHLLDKMADFWAYFSFVFANPKKVHKRIKKCRRIEHYREIVADIWDAQSR